MLKKEKLLMLTIILFLMQLVIQAAKMKPREFKECELIGGDAICEAIEVIK